MKPELFAAIVELMKRDAEWSFNHYTLVHKGGLILWIANGRSCFRVDEDSPIQLKIGLVERWRLWKHATELMERITIAKLKVNPYAK